MVFCAMPCHDRAFYCRALFGLVWLGVMGTDTRDLSAGSQSRWRSRSGSKQELQRATQGRFFRMLCYQLPAGRKNLESPNDKDLLQFFLKSMFLEEEEKIKQSAAKSTLSSNKFHLIVIGCRVCFQNNYFFKKKVMKQRERVQCIVLDRWKITSKVEERSVDAATIPIAGSSLDCLQSKRQFGKPISATKLQRLQQQLCLVGQIEAIHVITLIEQLAIRFPARVTFEKGCLYKGQVDQ